MTGKSTLRRLVEMESMPKDPVDVETLVEGSVILSALAVLDYVHGFIHRRAPLVALGVGGLLVASALRRRARAARAARACG